MTARRAIYVDAEGRLAEVPAADTIAGTLATASDITNALGFQPADASVLGDIQAALDAINGE